MGEYIQIITSTDSKENAEKIAEDLIQEKLAACTQVLGPVKSSYWWEGNVENANEWICIIKSKKALYNKIEKAIKKIHPYQMPEIMALPVVEGNSDYLKWLDSEVKEV
ncbi:MAG: divalent-cation tolerance protein CutA [Candidatus Saelkia tenebricola]|nr:divalent-cation tolerance protein CutA [Candidatus Saelkia tenebricola]